MSKWLYLIVVFVLAGLLYPAIYLFGLDGFRDGILFKVPTLIIYGVLAGFFLYPFVEGYRRYKAGSKRVALVMLVFGIIFPVVSGAFLIVLFESMLREGNNSGHSST
ncbi:hypothetical protein ACJJH9_06915 [Microbulbifer sp. DLAB2-AF]|uniref:hypothetical protein n=1 Tax=Microbulbifer sp. DLAB2-AF TaxID=3243395 RepID=UPI0040390DF9